MKHKTAKKKIAHKVISFQGRKKNSKDTFIEFGWVENPTFNNDIYIMVNSAHKGGSGYWEVRTDEALMYIQGLAMALNIKNGIRLEKLF